MYRKYIHITITGLLAILLLSFFLDCSKKKKISSGFELVTSRHGEFRLVEERKGDLSFKKIFTKEDQIFESSPGTNFHFYRSFQIGSEDVILFLSENQLEKSCTNQFFIVSVKKMEDVEILEPFGNCNADPEITEEGEKLTFQFSSTSTNLSQTVVYSDRKLEITESKLSKK